MPEDEDDQEDYYDNGEEKSLLYKIKLIFKKKEMEEDKAETAKMALRIEDKNPIEINNKKIPTLKLLSKRMETLDERSFKKLVTPKKNHIQTWISDTIGDKELAKRISNMHNTHQIASAIGSRVRELEPYLKSTVK